MSHVSLKDGNEVNGSVRFHELLPQHCFSTALLLPGVISAVKGKDREKQKAELKKLHYLPMDTFILWLQLTCTSVSGLLFPQGFLKICWLVLFILDTHVSLLFIYNLSSGLILGRGHHLGRCPHIV